MRERPRDIQPISESSDDLVTAAARDQATPASTAPAPGARSGQMDMDAYVRELVASAPPLSSRQRDVLALLFGAHRCTAACQHR